jgi:hypothetical protein
MSTSIFLIRGRSESGDYITGYFHFLDDAVYYCKQHPGHWYSMVLEMSSSG